MRQCMACRNTWEPLNTERSKNPLKLSVNVYMSICVNIYTYVYYILERQSLVFI